MLHTSTQIYQIGEDNRPMVWDDSRIEEAATTAERAIIDFLEQFDGPDSETIGKLAADIHELVESRLHHDQAHFGE